MILKVSKYHRRQMHLMAVHDHLKPKRPANFCIQIIQSSLLSSNKVQAPNFDDNLSSSSEEGHRTSSNDEQAETPSELQNTVSVKTEEKDGGGRAKR
ncbi:hypothetical protein CVT26_013530 [Gymnopilus dilepis]|uniref:Uncharacterized protein n=1 Tax=Gymnopilus dilepis TaxID=231916 RepID=A0A409Y5H2_9AGAR|nr:hypothetical protein CVT26_013530 [Gymnopilus dilepis]